MDSRALFELKCRLLLNGVSVDRFPAGDWKERTEHLYQHDGGAGPSFRYPQDVVLTGCADPALDTVVNIRFNAASSWRLAPDDGGGARLSGPDLPPRLVETVRRPAYYAETLSTGVPVGSVVQHLGRDALGVVPNNYCSYFADDLQCRFCEIEPSYRDVGSYPTMRKPTAVIVEAVNLALAEPSARHLIMTAGNLRSNDRTAEYYCDILERLRDGRHGRVYRYGSIMPPETLALLGALKRAGLDGVGFNLEFFDPEQFARLAPGKAGYGYGRMMAALTGAVDVFGAGHVFSNLVFGIQSWRKRGVPVDFAEEHDRCLAATAKLLAAGVVPLFTLYHTSGKNAIGPVALDVDAAIAFHLEYARLVHGSGILPAGRPGVLFNTGTIANSVCNDALAAVREEAFRAAPCDRQPAPA